MKCLVAGAGGFIGGALVTRLKEEGHSVTGVDIKHPSNWEQNNCDYAVQRDLRNREEVGLTFAGSNVFPFDEVYQCAADMGGMGYVFGKDAQIMHNNTLINAHMLDVARIYGAKSYLFTSSACVYPEGIQMRFRTVGLKEDMAFPANPQDGYGWEKIMAELACKYYAEQRGLNTHVVRLHNIFGPHGTWKGGKEKSLAAICRKVIEAPHGGAIEVWGDGNQVRTFCYIQDAVTGIIAAMRSPHYVPFNIGSEDEIRIHDLARAITEISGKALTIQYVDGPQGVKGRKADLERSRALLNWEPKSDFKLALKETYHWIRKEIEEEKSI